MTRALTLLLVSSLALAGCDQLGLSDSGTTTDTNMRSVDIQAGTASDEMIILDQASGDGTAIDTSRDTGPAAPRPPSSDSDDEGEGDAGDNDRPARARDNSADGDNGDQVIRPPASGAEPDSPPEPAEK
jgi:hypothetical protein